MAQRRTYGGGNLAGYFDGEGCVVLRRNLRRYWAARITFAQTQPEGIALFTQIYGGRARWQPARGTRQRPQLRWELAGKTAVQAFLTDVRPYLREKRAQAVLVLRTLATAGVWWEGVRDAARRLKSLKGKSCRRTPRPRDKPV